MSVRSRRSTTPTLRRAGDSDKALAARSAHVRRPRLAGPKRTLPDRRSTRPEAGSRPDDTVCGVPVRAKRKQYDVEVERSGRATADGDSPLDLDDAWTPEHLVLFALARCTLSALDHHARRASIRVSAGATAGGAVSERADGSWGFVDVECRLDVDLDPVPDDDHLSDLLRSTERGCFVGASLDPEPTYHWRVNGADR